MSTVNGFWIGELGDLQLLSMESFIKQGHKYILWSYDVKKTKKIVPKGVIVEDANDILDKKECDFTAILMDESFPEGTVFRLKSSSAKVYSKTVEYEETTVVGYLKPVETLTFIGKVSIKELYVEGVSSGRGTQIAPPPRKKPPRQTVSFMAELGSVLKSGVKLKDTNKRAKEDASLENIMINISDFVDEMSK